MSCHLFALYAQMDVGTGLLVLEICWKRWEWPGTKYLAEYSCREFALGPINVQYYTNSEDGD